MLLGDGRRLLQVEEAARRRFTAPPLSGTVRLGAVEEVAGGSLPPALGLFASSHPNVKLEVPDRREFAADRAARRWKTGRRTTAGFIAQPGDSAFASASWTPNILPTMPHGAPRV